MKIFLTTIVLLLSNLITGQSDTSSYELTDTTNKNIVEKESIDKLITKPSIVTTKNNARDTKYLSINT